MLLVGHTTGEDLAAFPQIGQLLVGHIDRTSMGASVANPLLIDHSGSQSGMDSGHGEHGVAREAWLSDLRTANVTSRALRWASTPSKLSPSSTLDRHPRKLPALACELIAHPGQLLFTLQQRSARRVPFLASRGPVLWHRLTPPGLRLGNMSSAKCLTVVQCPAPIHSGARPSSRAARDRRPSARRHTASGSQSPGSRATREGLRRQAP